MEIRTIIYDYDPLNSKLHKLSNSKRFKTSIQKKIDKLVKQQLDTKNIQSNISFNIEETKINLYYQQQFDDYVIAELESFDLIKKDLNIGKAYINDDKNQLIEVLAKAKKRKAIFDFNFKTKAPITLNFVADKDIATLVILLNKLGIFTTGSCGGHLNSGLLYPYVEFPNIMLFNLLSSIQDWSQINDSRLIIQPIDSLLVQNKKRNFTLFFKDKDLHKSKILVGQFVKFLTSKIDSNLKVTHLDKKDIFLFTKLWNQNSDLLTSSNLKMTDDKALQGFKEKMFDYFGLYENNKLIGFILYQKIDDEIWLKHMLIDKNHRNKGMGKLLLENSLSSYKSNVIKTEVLFENKDAKKFFMDNGFKLLLEDNINNQSILIKTKNPQ